MWDGLRGMGGLAAREGAMLQISVVEQNAHFPNNLKTN